MAHSTTGDKIFAVSFTGVVAEFDLITPFEPVTGTFSEQFNVKAAIGGNTVRGIAFSRDGLKMFVTSPDTDLVYQFTMNAPFDLAIDPTLDGSFLINEDTEITSISFSFDGMHMFISGNTTYPNTCRIFCYTKYTGAGCYGCTL